METDKKIDKYLTIPYGSLLTFLIYMSQEVLSQKEGCEKGLNSSKYAVSGPGDFLLQFSRTNLAELPGLRRDDHRARVVIFM